MSRRRRRGDLDRELLWLLRCRPMPEPRDLLARPRSGPIADILDLPLPERHMNEGGIVVQRDGKLRIVANAVITSGVVG